MKHDLTEIEATALTTLLLKYGTTIPSIDYWTTPKLRDNGYLGLSEKKYLAYVVRSDMRGTNIVMTEKALDYFGHCPNTIGESNELHN